MTLDLDTFLVTVYCIVDDLYRDQFQPWKPVRPGRRAVATDSEVLTLIVLAQWHPRRSERAFLRHVRQHWRCYFPRLLSQSAFNRRARDLHGVLGYLGPAVCRQAETLLGGPAPYEVLDAVPVPLLRRCRGERHKLFTTEAGIGCGGSDREWYYGVHLLGSVSPQGLLTGFVLGPANVEERWLAEALLRWRRWPRAAAPTVAELKPVLGKNHHRGGWIGPTGRLAPRQAVGTPADGPYLADLGFAGERWVRHWRAAYQATVLTKADYRGLPAGPERQRADRWLAHLRQVVETVFGVLTESLGLKFPRARTEWGLWTRLAAKVAAFDLAVYINHLFGRPPLALFNPLD
jgi:hypothetical protein